MGLIVALDDAKSARGDLFWDDGDSIGKKEACNTVCLLDRLFCCDSFHGYSCRWFEI